MRLRPALLLAAPAGVVGGHAIGYLVAPGGSSGGAAVHHGYLALVVAVAVPLAVAAAAWAATGARRAAADVSLGPLLLAQWVLFAGQEVAEHAAAGHGAAAVVDSPALWCGLAAQVLTAGAAVVILRASAAAGARLIDLSRGGLPIVLPRLRWQPSAASWSTPSSPAAPSPPRGPPATRFA